ncbi:helix-turn-helix domain-containing protein [Sphingorhabdus sp.]|jgi:transcriptional regulator with XRE-family HTH domain|uniref:helix-turn-helix domain-containing protein n=1 Tax=Sphingorhabdus sp. TaxID=1902408 RepID=UPI003BB1790E|nr:helix-turn-helix transcriptional regulator [Sphingomonadales bacterium]MBL0021426.1 helix-turn-helix transcriptional regulator [Sphingomonadales bacterium]
MLSRIREVRKTKRLTLLDVAERCVPPTTAQTIGRLETGTRTVSLGWLNRIAAALGVDPSELVQLPDQQELPVAAHLGIDGSHAPTKPEIIIAPRLLGEMVGLRVLDSIGDYRRGDEIWLEQLQPGSFAEALNCDVLVPRPAGRFLFGRLIGREEGKLHLLPLAAGSRQQVVADPAWIGRAAKLVRAL